MLTWTCVSSSFFWMSDAKKMVINWCWEFPRFLGLTFWHPELSCAHFWARGSPLLSLHPSLSNVEFSQPGVTSIMGDQALHPWHILKKSDLLWWKKENFRQSNLIIIILFNNYSWMGVFFFIYFWIFLSQTEVKCKSKRQRWILVSASSVPVCLVEAWILQSSFA